MEDKELAAKKTKRARSGCISFPEVLFRALLAAGGVQEPCGIFSTDSHSPLGGRASPGLPGEADQKSTPHTSRKAPCPRAPTTWPTCPPPMWLGPGGCHLKEGDNTLSNWKWHQTTGGRGTTGWAICSWTSPHDDPEAQTEVHLSCPTHLIRRPMQVRRQLDL